jgi:hypothetical protein
MRLLGASARSLPTPAKSHPFRTSLLALQARIAAIHQMVLTLDKNGLISRRPGAPRSIEVLVPPQDLPLLEFLLPSSVVEHDE